MSNKYGNLRVYETTRAKLKIIASIEGKTMIELLEDLVEREFIERALDKISLSKIDEGEE